MSTTTIDPTLTMYYEDDYFGEPWRTPEVALLIHGVAESSQAWFGLVPILAGSLRAIRPDMRGFGQSTVPPEGYAWSMDSLASDLVKLLDGLDVPSAHIIGAKIGGTVAAQFAINYPERTRSLSIISGPMRAHNTGGSADLGTFAGRVRAVGVRGWADETQRARLGSDASEAQLAWWTAFMSRSDARVVTEITTVAGQLDISADLPRIKAPTLVVTTERSALASVEVVREWQETIPNSELLTLPGDSYHVAAAEPQACAEHVLEFIQRVQAKAG